MNHHKILLKISLGLLFAGFFIVGLGASAFAHAYLQKTDPPAGSTLATAPEHLQFYFSEDVDSKFSQLTLFDSDGKRLADLHFKLAPNDPLHLDATLPHVSDGTYTIAWRVMSAVDGHTTKGTYPFRIGKESTSCLDAPPVASTKTGETPTPWGRIFFHWLSFFAIIGLAGAFFFQALVIRPSLQKTGFPTEHWASVTLSKNQKFLLICWALFIFTTLLDLVAQAMSTSESSLSQLMQSDVMIQLLSTRFGLIWLVRIGLALLLGLLIILRIHKSRAGLWSSLGLSSLVLLSISLSSHSAALKDGTILAILVDWVHLLTSAIWVGGLFQLMSVAVPALRLIPELNRYKLISQIAPRFSSLALASVILLIATGVYSALRQISSWEAFFTTTYGRAIAIKHVLLIFTIGVAAIHFLNVVPHLSRIADSIAQATAEQAQSLIRRFRSLVSIEAAMVVAVLFFAGILTLVPTASQPQDETALARTGPLTFTGQSQGLNIALTMCSDQVGDNEFDVLVADPQKNAPVADALQVLMGFNYLGQDLGGLHAVAASKGNGHYRTQGAFMNLAGDWEATVSVRRAGQAEDASVKFSLKIKDKNGQTHAESKPQYDAAMIEKGQLLYTQNCAACHGDSGRGDGPAAPTLKYKPADLLAHRGHHTDQDFLWVVRDGTGLTMPGFKGKLSEEEIRQIIAYIRQLKE